VVTAMPGRATRKRIMLAKRSRRKEQVLSVEECEKLIRWVETNDPGLLVYPVLCLFAGLRPELEATGMDWADVTLEHITVDASIAKDAETRIIEPLTPNLVGWIRAIRDTCKSPLPLRNLRRRWERAREVLATRCHASFLCELPLCHVPGRRADSKEPGPPKPNASEEGLQQRRDPGRGGEVLVNCTRG
jgi:integrase